MKTSKKAFAGFFGTAFTVAIWAAQAVATPLPPGSSAMPSPTVSLGAGGICGVNACGTPAATVTYTDFNGTNAQNQVRFIATMTQQVFLGTTFDGVTGTSFLWTVTNSAGSLDGIGRITATHFAGFTVDVGVIGTDSGPAPLTADRGAAPGSTVGFSDWGVLFGGIEPGQTATRFFIQTDAPSFDFLGSTQFLDGAIAALQTYEPANAVPEPSTLILLGSAFAVMGLRGGYRRNRLPCT